MTSNRIRLQSPQFVPQSRLVYQSTTSSLFDPNVDSHPWVLFSYPLVPPFFFFHPPSQNHSYNKPGASGNKPKAALKAQSRSTWSSIFAPLQSLAATLFSFPSRQLFSIRCSYPSANFYPSPLPEFEARQSNCHSLVSSNSYQHVVSYVVSSSHASGAAVITPGAVPRAAPTASVLNKGKRCGIAAKYPGTWTKNTITWATETIRVLSPTE